MDLETELSKFFIECRKGGCLSDEDIRDVLRDDNLALQMFHEFTTESDADFTEWVRENLRHWKRAFRDV